MAMVAIHTTDFRQTI